MKRTWNMKWEGGLCRDDIGVYTGMEEKIETTIFIGDYILIVNRIHAIIPYEQVGGASAFCA